MEKKSKAWLIGLPVATLTAFVVAGVMILNQNTVSSEMKGLYNFASVEQLSEQLSAPDSDFLENNIVCVNGTVYQFGESGVWESTGVAAEGSYIKNGVDGKDGVSSYTKMKELGFTGTEEDYNNILSNIGEYADEETSIYEKACILGFEGTPEDFINCFYIEGQGGIDGVDGEDGKDGRDGKDGKNGRNGTDGKDGRNGSDGKDGEDGCQIDIRGIYFFRDGKRDLIASGINAKETFSENGEIQWAGNEKKDISLSVDDNNSLNKMLNNSETEEIIDIIDCTGDIWKPVILNENESFISYATDYNLDKNCFVGYVKSTRVEKFENITTTAEFEEMLSLDEVMIVNTNYAKDYSIPLNDNKRNFNLNGFTVVENLNPSTIYKDGDVLDYDFNSNTYSISNLNLEGETNTNNAYEVGTILDEKPGDYTDDGWILLEELIVDISDTYTIQKDQKYSHTLYHWESTTSGCHYSGVTSRKTTTTNTKPSNSSHSCPSITTNPDGTRTSCSGSYTVRWYFDYKEDVYEDYTYIMTNKGNKVEVDGTAGGQYFYSETEKYASANTASEIQKNNLAVYGITFDRISNENIGKYIYCGLIPAS